MELERYPYTCLFDDPDFTRWFKNVKRGSVKTAHEWSRKMGRLHQRFVYESFGSTSKWEKDVISAYENGDAKRWRKFSRSMSRVISELFELIYKSWRNSGEPDHRTYLGNQKTFADVKTKNRARLSKLDRAAARALDDLVA